MDEFDFHDNEFEQQRRSAKVRVSLDPKEPRKYSNSSKWKEHCSRRKTSKSFNSGKRRSYQNRFEMKSKSNLFC